MLAGLLETADASEKRLKELGGVLEGEGQAEHALAEQFRLGAASYLVYIDGLNRLDDLRLDVVKARLELLHARLELAALLADGQSFPLPAMERGGEE
jgi:outer membrane protein TolC